MPNGKEKDPPKNLKKWNHHQNKTHDTVVEITRGGIWSNSDYYAKDTNEKSGWHTRTDEETERQNSKHQEG